MVGTALAARTASGFDTATGIPSLTLTRLLGETKNTGGLPPGAVVVVDEAGMVGSRQLAQVADLVEEASGKLILIGDHHQLAEIDAGGLFVALTARLPAVELTENVRQEHEVERAALSELRRRLWWIVPLLCTSGGTGSISWRPPTTPSIEPSRTGIAMFKQTGDPAEVLLIGHRNTTVDELTGGRVPWLVRPDSSTDLHSMSTIGSSKPGTEWCVSRTGSGSGSSTATSPPSPPSTPNGEPSASDSTEPTSGSRCLTVDLDDGHLGWGYAVTGHKAQGATARRAHKVAGDGIDREWIYVTMSRGQETNTIYLTEPELADEMNVSI